MDEDEDYGLVSCYSSFVGEFMPKSDNVLFFKLGKSSIWADFKIFKIVLTWIFPIPALV
jgi:hypothetical protein